MRVKKSKLFKSITAYLFVTTQITALFWVSASYAIAIYATVKLGEPFPIETLSGQAIETILGVSALKVVENIFEHNDGAIWGHSKSTEETET